MYTGLIMSLSTDEVLSTLESRNVVIEAYPGWGKTRFGTLLASSDRVKSVVYVTRTHEEVLEVLRFNPSLVPLYGKEKICPIWNRSEDLTVYQFCRRMRILNRCKYEYKAKYDIIRQIAGKKPTPDELRELGKKMRVCPYPSMLTLANSAKKVVTTYGFAFTFPDVLTNKDIVIFDESHEILSILLKLVEKIGDVYISQIVANLKRNIETRQLAYFVKACWDKTRTFHEFVECLDRAPEDHEFINEITFAYYSNRIYYIGKEAYVLRAKPQLKPHGQLFLTAYLPPFFLDLIPNLDIIRIPPPEIKIRVQVDTDATSRYEERTEDMYKLYAQKIEDYYVVNNANLVVFPSYEFMENVKKYLPDSILNRIKPPQTIRDAREGDIIFDVAGGVATEGVNPSPHLMRVIAIGLPYPPPTPELNLLSKIFGFDSVYTYLGLLKIVQALGRLRFREYCDAVLIDKRYKDVLRFMPPYFELS